MRRRSSYVVVIAALVACAVAFAGCGSRTGAAADTQRSAPAADEGPGDRLEEYHLESELLDQSMPQVAWLPGGEGADVAGRPLLVVLHGFGNSPRGWFNDETRAMLRELGDDAPVVVAPYGGRDSYWHDRASGRWGSYAAQEVVDAAVARFELDPERVSLGGFSMGGFGALDLMTQAPGRWCSVSAHEPALWERGADAAPGAFDGAADFSEHDVIGWARDGGSPGSTKLWLDHALGDAFIPGFDALVAELEEHDVPVRTRTYGGFHGMRFVRPELGPAFRFHADALASCGG